MTQPIVMAELWRGNMLESSHLGHAVICDETGQVVRVWGDPDAVIYPRSSCKMVQALPLIESGAADAGGLTTEQLALACASHTGAAIHTDRVARWLADLGLGDSDLRCGAQDPDDPAAHKSLLCSETRPCQIHNNCSGKHTGFLMLSKYLKAGPDYVDVSHPVQKAVKQAFEEVTGEASPGYGIDGCSAPNFATSISGLARAMGKFAGARGGGDTRQNAMVRLRDAMALHPDLVAGEGNSVTSLMRAMQGKVTLKSGAEGVYVAILPEQKLGVAIKCLDGGGRGRACAMASILVGLGVLDAEHPTTRTYVNAVQKNRRGIETGYLRPGAALT